MYANARTKAKKGGRDTEREIMVEKERKVERSYWIGTINSYAANTHLERQLLPKIGLFKSANQFLSVIHFAYDISAYDTSTYETLMP